MSSDFMKRKTFGSCMQQEKSNKRQRFTSSSDSGYSSMSGNITDDTTHWPLLSLLSNIDEPIPNGVSRRRFPDPINDKSILFACYGQREIKSKLRLCNSDDISYMTPGVPFERDKKINRNMDKLLERSRSENCSFFFSLDSILIGNTQHSVHDKNENLMICDIRDHTVASNVLPEEATGFWIRTFGEKQTFALQLTLWQVIHKEKLIYQAKRESFSDDHVTKVNELKVLFQNCASPKKPKKPKHSKNTHNSPVLLSKQLLLLADDSLPIVHFQPTFCSMATYTQVTKCLRECIDNGKYSLFTEMYEKFCRQTLPNSDGMDRNSIEFKLFLSCENSLFHACQGNTVDAKRLLQHVVENVISKSPNKTFLLNRAYLYLANVHLMDGNCGLAEECLNVLQFDKKHGSCLEDIALFYANYAVALMVFCKKLPWLSNNLQAESLQAFAKAEHFLRKSSPFALNRLCWLLLNKARLFVCRHYGSCCGSNADNAVEWLTVVEGYGQNLVSLKNQCLFNLVKSEISFMRKEQLQSGVLLSQAEEMAKTLNFYEEKRLCEVFRLQHDEHVQKQGEHRRCDQASCKVKAGCYVYDADESL